MVTPQNFTPAQSRAFGRVVGDILSDEETLATRIGRYLSSKPENIDRVVFSFIPALFSTLWSQDEMERFVRFFLLCDPSLHRELAKILLVHPSFFVFFSSIQSLATEILERENPSVDELLDLFLSHSYFIPSSLRSILRQVQDPISLFTQCFLNQILENPALYGLVKPKTRKVFPTEYNIEKVRDLVDQLKSKNSIQVIPENVSRDICDFSLYFFKSDIDIISEIGQLTIDLPTADSVYPIKINILSSDVSPTPQPSPPSIEKILRDLVIHLDLSFAKPTILETLDSALVLHAGPSKIEQELHLDEFKQMKRMLNAPDEVGYYINLLREAYEQRMKDRNETLKNSSSTEIFRVQMIQCSQEEAFLVKSIQTLLICEWIEEGDLEQVETDKELLCKDNAAFQQLYLNLVDSVVSFLAKKKYQMTHEQIAPYVFENVMNILTLDVYQSYHPEFVELDEKIRKYIEENSENLIALNSPGPLKIFQTDPSLLDLASEHLLEGFNAKTLMKMTDDIDHAISALINVLSFQGYCEIGADHILPMTLILCAKANPPHFCSIANYLEHFLLMMSEYSPVPQSLEYHSTVIRTASAYFLKELGKKGKKCLGRSLGFSCSHD